MKIIFYTMGLISMLCGLFGCASLCSQDAKLTEYNGTWYTRNKTNEIVIKNGKATFRVFYDGKWHELNSGEVTLQSDGTLKCGHSSYLFLKKEGHLLHAPIEVMDAPAQEDLYALSGYESEFPPLPVYIKDAETVTNRHLTQFSFSSQNYTSERFPLEAIDGIDGKVMDVSLTLSTRKGLKKMYVLVNGENNKDLLDTSYELTEEKELKLSELLLSEDVLKANPYHDSSDMMAPTITFHLDAKFADSENTIDINTSYDFKISKETAMKIVLLLINE